MGELKAIYCRSNNFGGLLIRSFDGWGRWSHVAGFIDDEYVVEARAFVGVVITPASEVLRRSSEFEFVSRPIANPQAGIEWAHSTVGKSYDYIGALSVPWHRSWQHDDKWFCSEHYETWLEKGGSGRFTADARGVSPNMSYYVK